MNEGFDLTSLLGPGMQVFVGGGTNEPVALLERLAAAPECAAGVTFTQFPLPGLNQSDLSVLADDARARTFFMAPPLRAGFDAGRVEFLPMQMRAAYEYLRAQHFDVVFTQVAYDRDGRLRFGPNVDFIAAALDGAGCVVAELNRALVAPAGAPRVDPKRIDHLVESNRVLAEYPSAEPDTAAREIGRIVASLIPDGACIQTGIGAIPAAILGALGDMGLQGLYFALAAYGWWAWLHGGEDHGELRVSLTPGRMRAALMGAAAIGGVLLGLALHVFTDASLPFMDSMLTSVSIAAQWMQTRKLLESWLVWLAVDVLYVGIFLYKELFLTAGLYAVFLGLAVMGFLEWRRSMRASLLPAAPQGSS